MAPAIAAAVIIVVPVAVVAAVPAVPLDAMPVVKTIAEQAPMAMSSAAAASQGHERACHEQNGGVRTHKSLRRGKAVSWGR
jgi:hypothetical protein